jgi:hypothetical protein
MAIADTGASELGRSDAAALVQQQASLAMAQSPGLVGPVKE